MQLVTVIIPTYNRKPFIARAIESVLNQSYPHIELIVVDDGSTDDTRSLVETYTGIQYVYKQNGRQASARNAGLSIANGHYIATLDSDDAWDPDFIDICVNAIVTHDLDFVFTEYIKTDEIGDTKQALLNQTDVKRFFYEHANSNQDWIMFDNTILRHLFWSTCPAPSSALLFKRSAIKTVWDEKMRVADDWDFVLTMIMQNNSSSALYKLPLWKKFIVGNNVYESEPTSEDIFNDLKLIYRKHQKNMTIIEKDLFKKTKIRYSVRLLFRSLLKFKLFISLKFLLVSFRMSPKLATSTIIEHTASKIRNRLLLYVK